MDGLVEEHHLFPARPAADRGLPFPLVAPLQVGHRGRGEQVQEHHLPLVVLGVVEAVTGPGPNSTSRIGRGTTAPAQAGVVEAAHALRPPTTTARRPSGQVRAAAAPFRNRGAQITHACLRTAVTVPATAAHPRPSSSRARA